MNRILMLLLYKLALALISLSFGSFTNVLIYRIPEAKSVFFPGSYCPSCQTHLSWLEKLPLISYLIQKAKCKHCGAKISIQYFLVELGFLLVAFPFINKLVSDSAVIYSQNPIMSQIVFDEVLLFIEFLFKMLLVSLCLALAVIDYQRHILPRALTYFGIVFSVIYFSILGVYYEPASKEMLEILPPFALSFWAVIKQVGICFFVLDAFTHFANKIFFGKKASVIKSPALTFGLKVLEDKISWIYILIIMLFTFGLYNYQFASSKILFEMMAFLLGISYLIIEIANGYFLPKLEVNMPDILEEKKAVLYKSVLGGGDVAFMAFMATVVGVQKVVLIFLIAVYILFVILAFKVIGDFLYYQIKSRLKPTSELKEFDIASYLKLQIPMGPALAVSFIAVIMFL